MNAAGVLGIIRGSFETHPVYDAHGEVAYDIERVMAYQLHRVHVHSVGRLKGLVWAAG